MKTTLRLHLLFLALLSLPGLAQAQSTAFTYNGRLNYNGAMVNGPHEMTFTLYNSELGATVIKALPPISPVEVVNGLFTVRIDFGEDVFTGPARWLEVAVRPVGGGNVRTLTPRQEVTSSPYAIRAQTAGTAANVSVGTVVKSLNGLRDDLTLAAGANVTITPNGNTLTLAAVGGGGNGIWSVNNNDAYYTAGNVGIGTNALTPGYRLDVVGATILRPGNGSVQFGSPNGELGMTITPTAGGRADLRFDGSALKLVAGLAGVPPSSANGVSINTNGNVSVGRSLLFGSSTRQMISLYDGGVNSTFGIGVQDACFYQRTALGSGFAWFYGGVHNSGQYNPGGGGTTLMILTGTGNLGIGSTTPQAKLEVVGQDALRLVGYQPFLTLYDSDQNRYTATRIQNVNGAMVFEPQGFLDGSNPNATVTIASSGNVSLRTLTIRGGADVAEPFEVTTADIAKGSVVVIDDEHPGKLKLSTRAYDMQVAGIVSGANGVNPGISLHQDGVLESGHNVALSGRVYVLADATQGAIKPGDLLTTSSAPGHAMKVTDHARAQGAILGKAMSTLKEGKGMVLVLVTLQ